MSEGPEVKRTADRLTEVLAGTKIVGIYSKREMRKLKRRFWEQK
jgi:hypothetical protein